MKMNGCSGATTLARWSKSRILPALLSLAVSAAHGAEVPSVRLGQGIAAYNLKDYSSTVSHLKGLRSQLPRLADYVAYYLGSSELQTGAVDDAAAELAAYWAHPVPSSPFEGKLLLIYARALLDQKKPASDAKAVQVLRNGYAVLLQPDGDFGQGRAAEAVGDYTTAAAAYQRVWYGFPESELAEQTSAAIERIREALGPKFPDATPEQRLGRARKLLETKSYGKARTEFSALAASLPEPKRDEAAALLGAAQYLGGDAAGAERYLATLKLVVPEAEAQRLSYLVEAAVRLQDTTAVSGAVAELDQTYPTSPWRLRALLTAGNYYAQTANRAKYLPLFRAAFTGFPGEPSTCPAHWRLVWDSWLADQPDRSDLLREHVEKCPSDSRAGTALYFLGRLSQSEKRFADARAYYQGLSVRYPHYFYGTLARERMADTGLAGVKPAPAVNSWLEGIDWPERRDFSALVANSATKARVERARLLMAAGLADLADAELRFGARTGNEQTHILALELAGSVPSPFHAMRVMKSFSSDYLAIPFENAPRSFWTTLFPLPYRDEVVKNSTARALDPYSVAALIRQETEFNPAAKSTANALGLMQLRPPTGLEMARKDGLKLSGSSSLFDPAISIRLGTRYVREQLDQWNGDWVRTLAAYNAGPGRLRQWLDTIPYREPAEFVESIPNDQTREYVQAVLRNADVYRTLYTDKQLKLGEVREAYDVPPVRLTTLPLAARTPGGGVKTQTAPVPSAKSRTSVKKPAPGKVAAKKASTATATGKVTKSTPVIATKKAAPKGGEDKKAPAAKASPTKKTAKPQPTA